MPGRVARPKAVFALKLTSMVMRCRAGNHHAARGCKVKADKKELAEKRLAFGELEAFARALLTVLLSLMCASIAREKTELLELTAQFGIKLE